MRRVRRCSLRSRHDSLHLLHAGAYNLARRAACVPRRRLLHARPLFHPLWQRASGELRHLRVILRADRVPCQWQLRGDLAREQQWFGLCRGHYPVAPHGGPPGIHSAAHVAAARGCCVGCCHPAGHCTRALQVKNGRGVGPHERRRWPARRYRRLRVLAVPKAGRVCGGCRGGLCAPAPAPPCSGRHTARRGVGAPGRQHAHWCGLGAARACAAQAPPGHCPWLPRYAPQ